MVEGARLEIVYTLVAYRGFESHPLRQFTCLEIFGRDFLNYETPIRASAFIGFRAFWSHDRCVLRESQNHRFYPKISFFVLRFSVRCERPTRRYACPEPLILMSFLKADLEVRYWRRRMAHVPTEREFYCDMVSFLLLNA